MLNYLKRVADCNNSILGSIQNEKPGGKEERIPDFSQRKVPSLIRRTRIDPQQGHESKGRREGRRERGGGGPAQRENKGA